MVGSENKSGKQKWSQTVEVEGGAHRLQHVSATVNHKLTEARVVWPGEVEPFDLSEPGGTEREAQSRVSRQSSEVKLSF